MRSWGLDACDEPQRRSERTRPPSGNPEGGWSATKSRRPLRRHRGNRPPSGGRPVRQNEWRIPAISPLCASPAPGFAPTCAELSEKLRRPSLSILPAIAYSMVRLDKW